METCKSPRKVMLLAYRLGQAVLPAYASKRSRKDFTLAQLFACLVVGEHQRKSYRGLEALLRDTQWYKEIGMPRPPDHNTLCRAFHSIVTHAKTTRMLDLLSQWFQQRHVLGTDAAIDSTVYDTHHRSRHYERRLRHHRHRERSE
jgi:IS5 family transposase